MKYIGVDKDGTVYAYADMPRWTPSNIQWWNYSYAERVHPDILPPLEPCCLYKITKDAYVMIEDRRK